MRELKNRIQHQYDQINRCRLVCIDGMYLLVDPEDLDFWAKEAGISLSEEEKEDVADYLANPHEPPDSNVQRTDKVIYLPGVKIYRKIRPANGIAR